MYSDNFVEDNIERRKKDFKTLERMRTETEDMEVTTMNNKKTPFLLSYLYTFGSFQSLPCIKFPTE